MALWERPMFRLSCAIVLIVALLATACQPPDDRPAATPTVLVDASAASPEPSRSPAATPAPTIDNTIDAAASLEFDPDAQIVDVSWTAAGAPNSSTAVDLYVTTVLAVEPVASDRVGGARFVVPAQAIDGADPDQVISLLWVEDAGLWVFLPTEVVDGEVIVWTPHFSRFGFITDAASFVADQVARGAVWLGDAGVDGFKALVSAIWGWGEKVASEIVEGLLNLDDALGGTAEDPPTCPSSELRPGPFVLASVDGNDDDKVLHCHWSEGERLTVRVTNNRPYGFVGVFDRFSTDAELIEWPSMEIVSGDAALLTAFAQLEASLGQAYIPSGATYQFSWKIDDSQVPGLRLKSTLAFAAVDPAVAVLLSAWKVSGVDIGELDRTADAAGWFDCLAGFVRSVEAVALADGVLSAVFDAVDLFKSFIGCVNKAIEAFAPEALGAGIELLTLIRNTVSSLADSALEGKASIEVEFTFAERATGPTEVVVSERGVGPIEWADGFDEAVAYVTSVLGAEPSIDRGFDGRWRASFPWEFAIVSEDQSSFDGWELYDLTSGISIEGLSPPVTGLRFAEEPEGMRFVTAPAFASDLLGRIGWVGSDIRVLWFDDEGLSYPSVEADVRVPTVFRVEARPGGSPVAESTFVVSANGVNVRLLASTNTEIVDVASTGDRYVVFGTEWQQNRWWASVGPLEPGRYTGWIATEFLEPDLTTPENRAINNAFTKISSATIPSICGHPPTTLVDGEHPAIEQGRGMLRLEDRFFNGIVPGLAEVNLDGRDLIAVAVACTGGGVAWPHELVFFEADGAYLAEVPLDEFDWSRVGVLGRARWGTQRLIPGDDWLDIETLASLTGDAGCCPSGEARIRIRMSGDTITVEPSPIGS